MSFCPNCGAQLPDGSKFCGKCGSPIAPAPGRQPQPAPGPDRKLLIPENTAGIPRLKIPAIPSIILIISSTITLISPAGRKAENC